MKPQKTPESQQKNNAGVIITLELKIQTEL